MLTLASLATTSTLNPHSKPFAPRQNVTPAPIASSSSSCSASTDGNNNRVFGDQLVDGNDTSFNVGPPFKSAGVRERRASAPCHQYQGFDHHQQQHHHHQQQQQQAEVSHPQQPSAPAPGAPSISAPQKNYSIGVLSNLDDDDYGLRGLARALGSRKSPSYMDLIPSAMSPASDLGVSDQVAYAYRPLLHSLVDSPFGQNFSSPLLRSWQVPEEYHHPDDVFKRLPRPIRHWPTDLLFFLFYAAIGDQLQIFAGDRLYEKGWRYNKVSGLWIARIPDQPPDFRTTTYERGAYMYFDVHTWQRQTDNFILRYDELAMSSATVQAAAQQQQLQTFQQSDAIAANTVFCNMVQAACASRYAAAVAARRRREESAAAVALVAARMISGGPI